MWKNAVMPKAGNKNTSWLYQFVPRPYIREDYILLRKNKKKTNVAGLDMAQDDMSHV